MGDSCSSVSLILLISLLNLILVVWGYPILNNNLTDHSVSRTQPFVFDLPDDTFTSSNGYIKYSIRSEPEGLIKGTLDSPLSVVERQKGSQLLSVFADGNTAYCGERRGGVRIIDITDPTNPEYLSFISNDEYDADGIFASGNYLYYGAENSLVIVDVTVKTNPEISKAWYMNADSWGIHMTPDDENTLYFCNSGEGLRIANITDRKNPNLYSTVTENIEYCRNVLATKKGSSTFAYVLDSGTALNGILMFNVTNKTSPQFLCKVDEGVKLYNFAFTKDENYLLLQTGTEFKVFDIQDPSQCPFQEVAALSFQTAWYINFLALDEDFLYAAYSYTSADRGFYVVNLTNPVEPDIIADIQPRGTYGFNPFGGSLSNGTLCVASESPIGLYVFDISDKTNRENPILVDELNLGGPPYFLSMDVQTLAVNGDILFVGDNNLQSGVIALWIRDRENPQNVTSYAPLPCRDINSLTFDDEKEYLFVANDMCGLIIIDVRDIFDIKIVSNITLSPYYFMDTFFRDGLLYVADYSNGLTIIDVSDRKNPLVVTSYDLPYYTRGITVSEDDDIAYLSVSSTGYLLFVVNVSNIYEPEIIYLLSDEDAKSNYEICKVGDFLYIPNYAYSDSLPGFYIVNVSDPTQPVITTRNYWSNNYGYQVQAVEGPTFDYVYLTERTKGIGFFDVTDKSAEPVLLTSTGGLGYSFRFVYEDNFGYTADSYYGFTIIGGNTKIYETKESFLNDFVCGNVTVFVDATDSTEGIVETEAFVVRRNTTCSYRGGCLNNKCDCQNGYVGEECEEWECWGVSRHSYQVCSGHGSCLSPDTCDCIGTGVYSGSNCEYWTCFGIGADVVEEVCLGHGNCLDRDTCYCQLGYGSSRPDEHWICDLWYCNAKLMDEQDVCSGRGECVDFNRCDCSDGYEGDDCDTWSCFGVDYKLTSVTCSGNGECTAPGNCVCKSGRRGDNCETNLLYYTVMTPILSLTGITIFISLICCFCVVICCCCCCFMILMCCLLVLSAIVFRQRYHVRKFSQLKNFDLLLKEQEMEADASVAHLRINKELYMIPFEEIKVDQILGEGGSKSVVFKAFWKNKTVAFKCFKTRHLCGDQESYDEFEKEVEILASVNHPHVVSFFGATMNPPRIGIVMEFCEHGDLEFFVQSFREKYGMRYPLKEKLRMLFEITMALDYLHSRSIIHRDLKMENVLVNSAMACKLMDFGLSKIVDRMSRKKTRQIGTNIYMSPEICIGEGDYDEKCDVFSFGIMVWVLLTENAEPYGNKGMVEMKVASNPDYRPKLEKLDEILKDGDDDYDGKREWIKEVCYTSWSHDGVVRWSFKRLSDLFREKTTVFSRSRFLKEEKKNDDNIDHQDEDDEGEQFGGTKWIRLERFVKVKEENEALQKEIKKLKKICSENGVKNM